MCPYKAVVLLSGDLGVLFNDLGGIRVQPSSQIVLTIFFPFFFHCHGLGKKKKWLVRFALVIPAVAVNKSTSPYIQTVQTISRIDAIRPFQ